MSDIPRALTPIQRAIAERLLTDYQRSLAEPVTWGQGMNVAPSLVSASPQLPGPVGAPAQMPPPLKPSFELPPVTASADEQIAPVSFASMSAPAAQPRWADPMAPEAYPGGSGSPPPDPSMLLQRQAALGVLGPAIDQARFAPRPDPQQTGSISPPLPPPRPAGLGMPMDGRPEGNMNVQQAMWDRQNGQPNNDLGALLAQLMPAPNSSPIASLLSNWGQT